MIFVSTGILSKGNRFWWNCLENIFDYISLEHIQLHIHHFLTNLMS